MAPPAGANFPFPPGTNIQQILRWTGERLLPRKNSRGARQSLRARPVQGDRFEGPKVFIIICFNFYFILIIIVIVVIVIIIIIIAFYLFIYLFIYSFV